MWLLLIFNFFSLIKGPPPILHCNSRVRHKKVTNSLTTISESRVSAKLLPECFYTSYPLYSTMFITNYQISFFPKTILKIQMIPITIRKPICATVKSILHCQQKLMGQRKILVNPCKYCRVSKGMCASDKSK